MCIQMTSAPLRIFVGDQMGAPRLNHEMLAERFRTRFQSVVDYEDLPKLAVDSKVHIRTLKTWHSVGVSQPDGTKLSAVARALKIQDAVKFFLGDDEPTIEEKTSYSEEVPQASTAPSWMHEALDDAYASPYSDFVHLIVTWAAKNQPRTGT